MIRAIKYELNPTNGQRQMLNQAFGNCRFVYNWALNKKIKAYQGEIFENQKYLRQNLKKLRVEQRSLQRKFKKGLKEQSNNYYKQRLRVAKLHEKIANQRKDLLHKVTTYLATTYETVCIEDLYVRGMVKNHNLALAISDCGWGMFRQFLEYKVRDLRVIGRFEPSSQICNVCGDRNRDLKLSDREWTCNSCGVIHDRDVNASRNILKEGLKIISGGTLDNTDGDPNKTSVKKHKSVKSEAQPIAFGVGG